MRLGCATVLSSMGNASINIPYISSLVYETIRKCSLKCCILVIYYKVHPLQHTLTCIVPGRTACDAGFSLTGCGTGKYLKVNSQVHTLGCDYCGPLVEIARNRGCEVMVCDNLNLPFRDQGFDAIISIGGKAARLSYFAMKKKKKHNQTTHMTQCPFYVEVYAMHFV